MSLILSVYSKDSFKEFNLPAINNSDYELIIKKDYLKIQSDLRVPMEIVDNQWTMKTQEGYRLFVDNARYDNIDLTDGLAINLITREGEQLSIVSTNVDSPFHAFDKYRITSGTEISFGKDPSNDVVYDGIGVSRKHAVIKAEGSRTLIKSEVANGIYINSEKVIGIHELRFGDYINIVGLHVIYLGNIIAIDSKSREINIKPDKLNKVEIQDRRDPDVSRDRALSGGKTVYRRAPRYVEDIETSVIEIEGPPQLPEAREQSMFMTIGPSVTMALPMLLGCMLMIYSYSGMNKGALGSTGSNLFMYSGLVMAVSSAIVGITWTLINRKQQKKELAALKELRLSKYGEYLIEKTAKIKARYEQAGISLNENYPEASVCLNYNENAGDLWTRNISHKDFLTHRLGMGDTPFPMDIVIPQKKFSLYDDELGERPELIKTNYSTLYDVPVTVDLNKHKLVGIVGDVEGGNAVSVAKTLSAQIAAGNCYTDVKLVYIYDESRTVTVGEWDFARWLPHVWAEDKKTRFIASNAEEAADILYELGNIFRERAENAESISAERQTPKPHYVLFVADASMLEGEMFAKYALDSENQLGITTVILARQYEELPNQCEFIIENNSYFQGFYETSAGSRTRTEIRFDKVDSDELDQFARRISKLQVMETEMGGDIPTSLTFFEMMNIKKPEELPIRELWTKSKIYDNIRGLLGHKAGGAPMYLDVHEKFHGPHGLVAGTTGSGKSETLQTYILSLAVNYSPDDIAFFIIDYKGGGMANLFEGLPHMAGQISNLSGNQVKRAMISIKSENRRRQRIFTDNGVNNINNYTRMYKNGEATTPVPHLFIIIDEFAELKREEPEFMRELISVAQVGRSLGVHLILATQKPSGTVDDNIWSNSRFRLCLRVQDKQDSNDMLHKPDAAYITQAGRCYLQVGNDELYELFQSGYSGAVYDENSYTSGSDVASLISLTGKVDMTGNTLKQKQKKTAEIAWVELLAEVMLDATAKVLAENDGEMNDPENSAKISALIYNHLSDRNIDYPKNKFNSARLVDFINVYSELSREGETPEAEEIIMHAQNKGRKLPQQKEHTELDAVKEYLAKVSSEAGYANNHQLWMPVLSDKIHLAEFSEFITGAFSEEGGWKEPDKKLHLNVLVGRMDDPENQNQMPYTIDFAEDGNVAICGAIVSGKSTTMQTVTYSLIQHYSPEAVNIYAIDFSSKSMSAFESAPHVGGVMYENDDDKIAKFFNMINDILEERKRVFRGGNYKQYVRVNGVTIPAIFVMIDNYGAFKQKTDEAYEEDVIRLAKEGVSNGIYMVVTGGGFNSNEITTRIGESFSTVLTLALKDRFEYGDLLHTMQIDVMPESGIKGRGLAYYGNRILEYQTALALPADNDYERIEKIREICDIMSERWSGKRARPIPVIPEKPLWEEFALLDDYREMGATIDRLPIGYDASNAAVYGINLADTFCYGIYGEMQTGKTNLLRACVLSSIDKGAEIVVLDAVDRPLGMFKDYSDVNYFCGEEEIFECFKNLIPEFKQRRERKTELTSRGKENDEMFKIMNSEFRPMIIFIPELDQFINMIYKSEYEMKGFIENVFAKGQNNGIYFFSDLSLKNKSNAGGYPAFDSFIGYKTGINMGGKTANNTTLNFDYLTYSEQTKADKVGIGTLPEVYEEKGTSKVVIPLVRRVSKEESDN